VIWDFGPIHVASIAPGGNPHKSERSAALLCWDDLTRVRYASCRGIVVMGLKKMPQGAGESLSIQELLAKMFNQSYFGM
jgi:hypothetical protein